MNRAFYGITSNMRAGGIPTNAIYGFLNIYYMIESKYSPDYVAVTFDLRAPTFRHKMYKEYKAHRKGMPDDLRPQISKIKEVLKAMNIIVIEKEGFEADDILGTVANINSNNNIFTYILTGDKDSLQLISDTSNIIIPTTKAGKTEYNLYDRELLNEKFGINEKQVIEVKSIMGDSSDNIPGVAGIGEKGAYNLIQKYNTLENIYMAIDNGDYDFSEKIKEKLLSSKDIAFLSKQLATIDINVDINLDYNLAKKSEINYFETYKIFKELNLNKFLAKYTFDESIFSENIENDLESITDDILNIITLCDINQIKGNITSYLLNVKDKAYFNLTFNLPKEGLYIFDGINVYFTNDISVIVSYISSNIIKLGYNIKQDLRYFFESTNGCDLINFNYDLMIAMYLLDSNKGKYPFVDILGNNYSISFKEAGEQLNLFSDNSTDDTYNVNIYLKCIFNTYNKYILDLESNNLIKLFNEIEIPLTKTLANMEFQGMYINKDKLLSIGNKLDDEISKLITKIYELAGEEFNISSTKQLSTILFDKLGLTKSKKTKTGYSTDKEVLENLENEHEIIKYLLDYRKYTKLKSTYVDGIYDKVIDNRVHTTFMQTVTATGRLSSTEPNLQNIPARYELGKEIRSFFEASNGNVLIDADYSQIELRVLAHLANDPIMIEAFLNNEDIHKVTASQIFNVDISEVTSIMRNKAKSINFGIVYGISDYGLSKDVNISVKEANEYITNYLNKYSKVKEYMENCVKEAKEKGYITTLLGRKREIPEITSSNYNLREFGKRVAMNTPVQGTAADIIKVAMNDVYNKLKKYKSKLIMQVHDELIIEAPKDEAIEVQNILKTSMENIIKLNVPLISDVKVAKSWYDAK